MAEFKVGGKVVCVKKGTWINNQSRELWEGPKYNDIVTIAEIYKEIDGDLYLKLSEYPFDIYGSYAAIRFLPLDDFQQVTFEKLILTVPVGAQ